MLNREQRYRSDALTDSRYHQVWHDASNPSAEWSAHLHREKQEANLTAAPNPIELANVWMETLNMNKQAPDVVRALQLLGDPKHIHKPVYYPHTSQEELEKEHFKWFVNNEKQAAPSCLKPIDSASINLSALNR